MNRAFKIAMKLDDRGERHFLPARFLATTALKSNQGKTISLIRDELKKENCLHLIRNTSQCLVSESFGLI